MQLTIRPVTKQNRVAILKLEVAREQQDFIETTYQCLTEAEQLSIWRPVGIYQEEILIGFAMYGEFLEEGIAGRVWLDRLLIDKRYQGKHFGSSALPLLMARLVTEYGCQEIYLSLYEENQVALSLYQRNGFVFNGEVDTKGEKVMVRKMNSAILAPFLHESAKY